MKGYKVTNGSRTKIWGIAASCLTELKSKASKKFQVVSILQLINEIEDEKNSRIVLLDGTIIDNEAYFQTLPSQTVLIIAKENENLCTGADIIYNALRAVNIEYLRVGDNIKQFFEENIKEKLRVLTEELTKAEGIEDKTTLSRKNEHLEWFEGLETTCQTKEDFLKRRCKDRINGYFYKASSDLRKSCTNSSERVIIENALLKLKTKLRMDDYNGGYFDRRDKIRLCNEIGLFKCNGVWDKERCLYVQKKIHEINPYRSREERIVFSTWNLDHRIEKTRTIIPCILTALRSIILKNANKFDFDYDLIYSLLFTSQNLRLVHVVCHDKGAHVSAKLDPENVVVSLRPKNGITTS